MPKHKKQTREKNCGQTCLAIILDKSIEEVERVMGRTGVTYPYQLRRCAKKLGFSVSKQRRATFWQMAPRAVVRIQGKARLGHYIVKIGSMVYDPADQKPLSLLDFVFFMGHHGSRVTSYFEVEP